MMARQVREMGIMKALGATSAQLLLSYALLVELIAVTAWVISLYPSWWGAQAFVDAITRLLNFDVADRSQTWGARAAQVAVALLVPLLVALPALLRGTGVTVMQALADYGLGSGGSGASRLERWAARIEMSGRFVSYALRSVLRRRGRFFLSLSLLATAGAIFLAAVNTARSWEVLTQRLYTSRHYDFEVGFSRPVEGDELASKMVASEEIAAVEIWQGARVAEGSGRTLPVERTYPDGAHGAFSLVAPPAASEMVTFDVTTGRMPSEAASEEVVINQVVPGAEQATVGDSIVLSIAGQVRKLRLVGKVEEVGTGAMAYVNQKTLMRLVPKEHRNALLRVAKAEGVDMKAALGSANRILDEARAPVAHLSPLTVFENAVAAHFEILIHSLLLLAALTALVGIMGLSSALGAKVAEATRELAVLRAVGATGPQIRSLVVREALLVCGASFVAAGILGIGLSTLVGRLIGMMSFRLPLPLALQGGAVLALGVALFGVGVLASLIPARRASALTVTQALRVL